MFTTLQFIKQQQTRADHTIENTGATWQPIVAIERYRKMEQGYGDKRVKHKRIPTDIEFK